MPIQTDKVFKTDKDYGFIAFDYRGKVSAVNLE
jgi:hypothetical protein